MNLAWNQLSGRHKVIISSLLIGSVFILLHIPVSEISYYEREVFGLHISFWLSCAFFAVVFAWPELWKKDFKNALLHSVVGAGVHLLVAGFSAKLPAPLNQLFGYGLILVPVLPVLLYAKLCLTQRFLVKDRNLLWQVYISGILLKLVLTGLTDLSMINNFLMLGSLLEAPLFYFFFYRLKDGRKLQDLLQQYKPRSKGQFLLAYFAVWTLLLICLYNFTGRIAFVSWSISGESEENFIAIWRISSLIYYVLTVLGLGYLCIHLLTQMHKKIQKPLGWLYLLSFVPVVNCYTVNHLLNQRSESWSTPEKWQNYREAERNKIAIGVIVLTLFGSFVSIVLAVSINNQVTEGGLYWSIVGAALSALAIYALYKGWGSFWTIVGIYSVLYALMLSTNVYAEGNLIISTVVARMLGLLIYYQAIKPSASEPQQEELATMHNS